MWSSPPLWYRFWTTSWSSESSGGHFPIHVTTTTMKTHPGSVNDCSGRHCRPGTLSPPLGVKGPKDNDFPKEVATFLQLLRGVLTRLGSFSPNSCALYPRLSDLHLRCFRRLLPCVGSALCTTCHCREEGDCGHVLFCFNHFYAMLLLNI